MRAVEASQLHQLERRDVRDDLRRRPASSAGRRRPRSRPRSPTGGTVRAGPATRRAAGQLGHPVDVRLGRRRDDPVHHRGGKSALAAIQSASSASIRPAISSTTPRTIGPFSGRLSQLSTVKGRMPAAGAAPAPARESRAQSAARAGAEVVADVRVLAVQPAGRRVVAIALFGHRQRHDPHRGIGHRASTASGSSGATSTSCTTSTTSASRPRARVRPRCRRSPAASAGRAGPGA